MHGDEVYMNKNISERMKLVDDTHRFIVVL